ncbi:MAG: hypothetical protein HY708_05350 [Ignavibacteriae bacterium]|nr:hypothetical protein [Ignavibacteriota bacterium]
MENLDRYWRAVQQAVCVKCIDSDGAGTCRLSNDDACGLRAHFSKIVESVLSVRSDTLEPYLEALRNNVCAHCKHQSPDGKCMVRGQLDCGLDRYFPLVIDAIESACAELDETPEAFGD